MAPTARLVALLATTMLAVRAALPPPLPLVCTPTTPQPIGCFVDFLPNRTFAFAPSTLPTDPFAGNMTIETCAFLCARLGAPVAGLELAHQCFCAPTLANLTAWSRPLAECAESACVGNPWQRSCGGTFRVAAYNYTCAAPAPPAPWQDPALPVDARVADLVGRLQPLELVAQLTHYGADIYRPEVQLPRFIVSQECLAGYDGGDIYIAPPQPHVATSAFPQPANMGATFDAALVRELASAIGDEARAAFVHAGRNSLVCMSPNLNLHRDARWGRNVESLGADPALLATLGAAYIDGLQHGLPGDGGGTAVLKVAAVPKHLGVYSVECYDPTGAPPVYPNCPVYRSNYNAVVDELDERESYLPAWRAAIVESRASGVMCSYNSINGVPSCANGPLLRGILEGEWGAQGFVISDADAVSITYATPPGSPPGHGYVDSDFAAATACLAAGTTISLEDDATYADNLPLALANGSVALAALAAEAARALRPRFAAGLYDPPGSVPWDAIPASVLESPAHHALARRAAAESYVLLANPGGLLPLAPPAAGGPATIAVVGPAANDTYPTVYRYSGHPATAWSMADGLALVGGAAGAAVAFGGAGGAGAVAAVAAADLGVVVLTGESEGESEDREALGLPADQAAFLASLLATRVPLVVIVVSGGPVDVSPALAGGAAIIAAGRGGMEAGTALADVLWGTVAPVAVLPAPVFRASWANASDFLSMAMRPAAAGGPPGSLGRTHRYIADADAAEHVLFPFGFGLSYTTWATTVVSVAPTSISAATLRAGATVNVTLRVANTGAVASGRVAHALLSRVPGDGDATWPLRWLPRAGFAKVRRIAPGGSADVVLAVGAADVSRWDAGARAFAVRPGGFTLAVRDAAGAPPAFTVTP